MDAAAVEAWDAWFRWRERGALRDLSVDATWMRVARALSAVEPAGEGAVLVRRLMKAFSSWRLLPDERILASAGTPGACWDTGGLVAVLNVARFVEAPCMPHARLDAAGLADMAALAVRMLDDAAMLRRSATRSPVPLRIGLIGLGDALALLGMDYGSAGARAAAMDAAKALARGCAEGSIGLARARAPLAACDAAWRDRARRRGLPPALIEEAVRYGLRCRRLTAITSQRRLALFANGVSDALDPASCGIRIHLIGTADGERRVRSPGYASTVASAAGVAAPADAGAVAPAARRAMCQVVQGWIDEPLDCPL